MLVRYTYSALTVFTFCVLIRETSGSSSSTTTAYSIAGALRQTHHVVTAPAVPDANSVHITGNIFEAEREESEIFDGEEYSTNADTPFENATETQKLIFLAAREAVRTHHVDAHLLVRLLRSFHTKIRHVLHGANIEIDRITMLSALFETATKLLPIHPFVWQNSRQIDNFLEEAYRLTYYDNVREEYLYPSPDILPYKPGQAPISIGCKLVTELNEPTLFLPSKFHRELIEDFGFQRKLYWHQCEEYILDVDPNKDDEDGICFRPTKRVTPFQIFSRILQSISRGSVHVKDAVFYMTFINGEPAEIKGL